jgi:hypothetical protein
LKRQRGAKNYGIAFGASTAISEVDEIAAQSRALASGRRMSTAMHDMCTYSVSPLTNETSKRSSGPTDRRLRGLQAPNSPICVD